MKIKLQIKSIGGSVLFEFEKENNTIIDTLVKAVAEKKDLSDADLSDADLRGADLRDAHLSDADLSDADLSDADLSGADLRGADLRDADLRGAHLRGAHLRDADLSDADLSDADLRGADLRDAHLSDADLSGADLRGAHLSDADLSGVKKDFFEVISFLNGELPAFLEKLRAGQINGSLYEGECCCLVGTIAKIKNCAYNKIEGLEPRSSRPAERFFLSIRPGHTPENSRKVKEIEGWILEFMENQKTIQS